MAVVSYPSPNCNARRQDQAPSLVVVHYTAMASAEAALARLCDPAAAVSAHYLIGEDGRLWQLVPEVLRAWHAGAGAWGDVVDVNSHSIGIELANPGDRPFAAAQMRALEALLAGVLARWGIPPEGVIGHQDMAPSRKSDPGPRFDWRRLARGGVSVWPEPGFGGDGAADASALGPRFAAAFGPRFAPSCGPRFAASFGPRFAAAAHRFGYRGDGAAVLAAFRARFRPGVSGALGPGDVRAIEALAGLAPGRGGQAFAPVAAPGPPAQGR